MKRVLITGSSSGFGRAMVSAFLAKGWQVIATLRRAEERLELFETDLETYGDRLRVLDLDVTLSSQRQARAEDLAAEGLDLLINNAGYALFGPLDSWSEEQVRMQMEVNFFGLTLLTQQLLPALRMRRGRIINISSVAGETALPFMGAYNASKFAVEGLTESLRGELAAEGVQVALVEPGAFRTDFQSAVQWGALESHCEPRMLEAFNRMRSKPQGAPLKRVVKRVVKLAHKRRMPLRNRVGLDSRGAAFGRWVLGKSGLAGLIAWAFRRLLPRVA